MNKVFEPSKQGGAVLPVTLILLAILFLVTMTGLRGGIIELQMSGTEQIRVEAFERAQSLAESTLTDPNNFVVTGAVGKTNCLNYSGCDESTVTVDSSLISGANNARSSIEVKRLSPLFAPPPRAMASSASLFQVASYQVEAEYDGSSEKLGKSTIGQGVMVLVGK